MTARSLVAMAALAGGLLLAGPARAEDGADKARRVLTSAPEIVGEVKGVSDEHMSLLAASMCTGLLSANAELKCLSPDDVANLAAMRAAQLAYGDCPGKPGGCGTSLEAIAEAEITLSGKVSAHGRRKIRLEVTALDVAKGETLLRVSKVVKKPEQLLTAAEELGAEAGKKLSK